jgi:uncharacterized protein (UPF0262 family)
MTAETNETAVLSKDRLIGITLDENSIARGQKQIEHEREVAIYDIMDGNSFALDGFDNGPYHLRIGVADDKLALFVSTDAQQLIATHHLPLLPFRRIMKDYFLVLDSYYQAVRTAPPSKIEAIDKGRRGLHDEGSQVLIDKLAGKITLDFDTARRLFTLLSALHWKG